MRYDFSVVIPFYNQTYELNLVLKGLAMQDYDKNKFEVVIVDDGSENRADGLVKKYSHILHIKYIYLEHTANRSRNRNRGVKESQGKRIIFLDGDVIPARNLISAFDRDTRHKPRHVSIGFINYLSDFDRNQFTEEVLENNFEMVWKLPIEHDSRLLTVDYEKKTGNKMEGKWQLLYTNCVCIPKKEFDAIGGFDEIFSNNWGAEDVELGFRLYQKGCTIEMNEAVRGLHIYHFESWTGRAESLKKNYDIFIRMHRHWSVELFIREYRTLAPKMIEIHNKIKKRDFIITEVDNVNEILSKLPDNVLICGIENGKLIHSDKIVQAFIPESKIRSPKIVNWMGVNTDYSDCHFELALLSKKYERVNFGLFQMLYQEIKRIARKVILVDEQMDILPQLLSTQLVPYSFPKQIIFLVSPRENFSINKHFMNLAIALHKIGVRTGYAGYHESNPNRGVMRTIQPEKIDVIQKLINHELEFIEDSIPAIIDMSILKGTSKCMGPRILWGEINYYHQEKEVVSNLVPLVTMICPRRFDDRRFYPENVPMEYIPVGVDKQKINDIQLKPKIKDSKFRFLWADQYTNFESHLALILELFTQLFGNQDDIELKIIHPGKNIIYTSYHNFYSHQVYDANYARLYKQYQNVKNIRFHQAELSDEEYSWEIYQCDCFIHLNSVMRINSWVLESVAFGKKPIILDNKNYDGYFSDQECFKVQTYGEAAFPGKIGSDTVGLAENDPRRLYLMDIPIKESLYDILIKIYQNKELVQINTDIANDFKDQHDWINIAQKLAKLL